MPIYAQAPLRLQSTFVGNPPLPPIDQSTNATPKFWRASGVSVSVGIFDGFGNPVDLSNLSTLQLALFASQNDVLPIFVKTITGAVLYPLITTAGWANGTQQNATFIINPADIDVSLQAQSSLNYWLQLSGITMDGTPIVYAAGKVGVYQPGLFLPLPPFGYVSLDQQTNAGGNTTFNVTSLDQTSILTVSGSARVSDVNIPIVGMKAGALQRVILQLPTTPGITLQIKNNFSGGQILTTITTGNQTYVVFWFYFDFTRQTWVLFYSNLNTSGTGSGTTAPLDVPANTTFLVPPNQQVLFTIPISIEGTMDIQGVLAQV